MSFSAIICFEHSQLQLDKFAKNKMEFILLLTRNCLLWLSQQLTEWSGIHNS